MKYDIGDCVIHKSFGVGYITALVEKQIFEDEARLYYEVKLEKATVWVPVDSDDPSPFRLLTNEDELAQYRRILTSKPKPLNDNFRARFSSVDLRLREGSLEAICEIVRDLTAREQIKHLSRGDLSRLQIAKDTLCKEWSASKDISLADAQQEIEALLQEGIRKNIE
jgi:RNA polymerase-interacting CarD/CdnL/TRCF family regulator